MAYTKNPTHRHLPANPDLVAEGDRRLQAPRGWMAKSHHRDGKGSPPLQHRQRARMANPLYPSSHLRVTLALYSPSYESRAGVEDHGNRALGLGGLSGARRMGQQMQAFTTHGAQIGHSLCEFALPFQPGALDRAF